ncbi:FK506-binding protein [Portunus trituberculatus]|uniref:peptidylprolyl isomerase n=1 Tax=Portunus trituberculatus TaxID=210409 RepID=A0A5B7KIF9_PORTR|nr:FK506-binding protein [Portunus trituberculatus]
MSHPIHHVICLTCSLNSLDRDKPFTVQIGVGQVIKGWDQGLLDLCPGDKVKLTIPPEMAYGDHGAGDVIPPNAWLVFEVDLISISDAPPAVNIFKQIDGDSDDHLSKEEVRGSAQGSHPYPLIVLLTVLHIRF